MRALFTLAHISGWMLIHWLTRQPFPHPPLMPPSVHLFPLYLQTFMLIVTHNNLTIQKMTCIAFFSFCFSSSWNLLHHSQAYTGRHLVHTLKYTHTHTTLPLLEMHGGRLLRTGKPSVNDSSYGKIMFPMQHRVRRWWKKMTFWMVKWVNVRSWPQCSHLPHSPSIPPSPPCSAFLSFFPSTRLFIEKARGGRR